MNPQTPQTQEPSPDYPREDLELTDMFAPFWRRRRTWLVLLSILGMAAMIHWMPAQIRANVEAGLDPRQVSIGLAILACIAFLWLSEALPLAATALLMPVLATITGVSDIRSALLPFADPLIFLFFGGFALASALSYQKIDLWLAGKLVSLGKGKFFQVSVWLFSGTAFLSMWMSNTATAALMLPVALGVIQCTGGSHHLSANRIYLLLGVAYASSLGGLATIIGSPPNGIAAAKLGISFAEWMKFGIPSMLILMPLMIIALRHTFRPDVSAPVHWPEKKFQFNWHRRVTLAIFFFASLCWVFGGSIASSLGITGSIDTLVALTVVFLLLYFRVLRWRDIDKGTDWGVLILFGGGLSLSDMLNRTGTSTFLARMVANGIDHWPIVLLLFALIAFVVFSGELASNTASAALLVPLFYSISSSMGMSAAALVIPIALASSCSFMLPVGTPPNAIVFSTGHIEQRHMLRAGLRVNFICIAFLQCLSYFYLRHL